MRRVLLIATFMLAASVGADGAGEAPGSPGPQGWWTPGEAAGISAGLAAFYAALGVGAYVLARRGSERAVTLALIKAQIALGLASLAAGLVAWASWQPFAVAYPLSATGLFFAAAAAVAHRVARRHYERIELRKMAALDASGGAPIEFAERPAAPAPGRPAAAAPDMAFRMRRALLAALFILVWYGAVLSIIPGVGILYRGSGPPDEAGIAGARQEIATAKQRYRDEFGVSYPGTPRFATWPLGKAASKGEEWLARADWACSDITTDEMSLRGRERAEKSRIEYARMRPLGVVLLALGAIVISLGILGGLKVWRWKPAADATGLSEDIRKEDSR